MGDRWVPWGARLRRARCLVTAVAAGAATAVGCSDIGPTSVVLDVRGNWSGSATLDGMPARSVEMTLGQTGPTVMGIVTIEGALTDARFDGTLSTSGILRWGSHDEECDLWGGQLVLSEDQRTLAGPLQVIEMLCPSGAVLTGVLVLERR